MRLIDADELKEVAHEMIQEDPEAFNGGYSYNAVTVEEIDEAPTIEAVPVVYGEWEDYPSHAYRRCTICKMEYEKTKLNVRANFCPHCGADMRKKV